jgi:diguanylate cyclase (GGDEF)-like protein
MLQRQKKIIIADADSRTREELVTLLQGGGFNNLVVAIDGSKIYEILRPYQESPEDLGLVIIDEDLPQCQIKEMCKSLSHENGGIFLSFIVLRNEQASEPQEFGLGSEYQVYEVFKPYRFQELLQLVEFLLILKNERLLRHQQQEKLITELSTRKLLDAKLKYMVAHDDLTGLLNRHSLEQHLRLIIHRNGKLLQNGALLFLDLDRFGLVNDIEGFDAADRLLVEVVTVIRKVVQGMGLFARIGSDELCLYLDHSTIDHAVSVAEQITRKLDDFRFRVRDESYNITASVGIAMLVSPEIVKHPAEFISKAHQACTIAKKKGRNKIWLYCEEDQAFQERQRDVYWVPLIREALTHNKFFLVFQPVVNLHTGAISHHEVLIRMRGGDNKIITPGEFIPVAERMGLIHGIELWVIEKSIDFLASLPSQYSQVCLAINLSGNAFQDDAVVRFIQQKLEMSWVTPSRLTFEITETTAVENFERTRTMINQLKGLGCQFALDDFGAGFCSFNYLKKFPVDYVKIDGQFIRNLVEDETDQVLVRSMHQIAQKLGKKTIAEYVESPKAISILREIGINYGQGYILGKPEQELLVQKNFQFIDL